MGFYNVIILLRNVCICNMNYSNSRHYFNAITDRKYIYNALQPSLPHIDEKCN